MLTSLWSIYDLCLRTLFTGVYFCVCEYGGTTCITTSHSHILWHTDCESSQTYTNVRSLTEMRPEIGARKLTAKLPPLFTGVRLAGVISLSFLSSKDSYEVRPSVTCRSCPLTSTRVYFIAVTVAAKTECLR